MNRNWPFPLHRCTFDFPLRSQRNSWSPFFLRHLQRRLTSAHANYRQDAQATVTFARTGRSSDARVLDRGQGLHFCHRTAVSLPPPHQVGWGIVDQRSCVRQGTFALRPRYNYSSQDSSENVWSSPNLELPRLVVIDAWYRCEITIVSRFDFCCMPQTYGRDCNPEDPFGCNSPSIMLPSALYTCPQPNSTGASARCVFSTRGTGDPCFDDMDCIGQTPQALLMCDPATQVCAPRLGQSACHSSRDCASGLFCNTTRVPPMCVPEIAVGGTCDVLGEAASPLAVWGGQCVAGAICYTGAGPRGVCTQAYALADGDTFAIPKGYFASAAGYGASLCASSLAVPVPNASTGYSDAQGRCVTAVNLTLAGAPCTSCSPQGPYDLPVVGDGSLVCYPASSNSCQLAPSSRYNSSYIAAIRNVVTCLAAAVGPTGQPCRKYVDSSSPTVGSCGFYNCVEHSLRFFAFKYSPDPSAMYSSPLFSSGSTAPADCVVNNSQAEGAWEAALAPTTLCKYLLPVSRRLCASPRLAKLSSLSPE